MKSCIKGGISQGVRAYFFPINYIPAMLITSSGLSSPSLVSLLVPSSSIFSHQRLVGWLGDLYVCLIIGWFTFCRGTKFWSIPGISGSYTSFDKGAKIDSSSLMEYCVSNMIDFVCTFWFRIPFVMDSRVFWMIA